MKRENFFRRYEYKYLLDRKTYEELLEYMKNFTEPDEYAKSDICNLYYDTPDYRLIRRSLESPMYKEKLRLRSYGIPGSESNVFIEIKKKFDHVVYKRRIIMPRKEAMSYLSGSREDKSQIGREIAYFKSFYKNLEPRMYISYRRRSYKGLEDSSFRITFDRDIRFRDYDLKLESGMYGRALLSEGQVLMEVKAPQAMPLWFTDFLTAKKIYKTSFSKYGRAYQTIMMDGNEIGERKYA